MQNVNILCMIVLLIIGLVDAGNFKLYTDCGIRTSRRQPRKMNSEEFSTNSTRNPKIMFGVQTKDGQYPWQVSLELLHPSLGFIGHWCGGVLIDRNWIISAAHCVHNELFNLPLPALWTVVLGEYNRRIESGYEQRIPVDKIILHEKYQNFRNDLVLMKLSRPAQITLSSKIRKICLPFADIKVNTMYNHYDYDSYSKYPDSIRDNNNLRNLKFKNYDLTNSSANTITSKLIQENLMRNNKSRLGVSAGGDADGDDDGVRQRNGKKLLQSSAVKSKRRNDKFAQGIFFRNNLFEDKNVQNQDNEDATSYFDCIATGWGKSNPDSELTDILLQTNVPIHSASKCEDAYGSFLEIHKGHLCAGNLEYGQGGTCVGDSGGPLQCRIKQNSPWILVGITSFGSGCAFEGYPDVYTKISYYRKWIADTISRN